MKHWRDPLSPASSRTALIVLNEPIPSKAALDRVWAVASLRICADGGGNRLHDLLEPLGLVEEYLPDLLKGDFDSLRDDVKVFYESKGVPCIQDEDKYATDLMKCLQAITEREAGDEQYNVLLLGGLTGRLDQTAHTLHMLLKLRKTRSIVWAISEASIACVLDEGEHLIDIDHSKYGKTCGILPVGVDMATITTKGLEWDITDWETSFDTQISTSNHVVAEQIEIKTDKPVVWTLELKSLP